MIRKIRTATPEEWRALRKGYIGGSDAAAVVGMNRFVSPWSLWAEKTGAVEEFQGNLATETGTYLEAFVAKKFEEESGKKVKRCNFSLINDKYPWAIANIDREVVGEDAGLEIKTTSELNMRSFKAGEYPEQYYAQCVHYLAVTGKARWYLAVLIGNREFRMFVIERDEDEIAALMDAEKAFWTSYIETNTPPPADGQSATTDAISAVYGTGDDTISVDITGLEEVLRNYQEISASIKQLEAAKEECANQIKAALGEATEGVCSGYRATWTNGTRKSLDSKALAADHPEINFGKYYKVSTYRTFKVKEK